MGGDKMRRIKDNLEVVFQAVFENSPHGIAIVDKLGFWVHFNSKVCNILDYTEEELKHKTFQDVTHPEDLKSDLDLYNQVLRKEIKDYSIAKRYIKKDATEIWVLLTVAGVFDSKGNFLFFVSQIRDTHEQIRQEQQIFNISEESRKFVKILSHDMREPLREISYELSKIDNMSKNINADIQIYTKNIEKLLGQVSNIIGDLSIYSSISVFKEKNKVIPLLNLHDFFNDLFPNIKIDFDKRFEVRIDKNDLFNLIEQLFINSEKFKKEEELKVIVSCYDYVGEWIIYYKDNGVGIDKKFWTKIFEPLFQVENSYSGNGIGLSICEKICKKYYGDICIYNSSKDGTIFKIIIKK